MCFHIKSLLNLIFFKRVLMSYFQFSHLQLLNDSMQKNILGSMNVNLVKIVAGPWNSYSILHVNTS